ncbi:MAG TPA: cytidylate kinase-like family protein [Baekduia sp.]|uniref:cytidylate kinase-like family protein n=1 Tax=Baekduia sp. TaxID=2600305 RepID=UPI002C529AE1|nr:cytidylate kinase-like family protein [Baekduia sp.]HMJ37597.1 cytidylate kinase-like family protein [Baekduia sp.]
MATSTGPGSDASDTRPALITLSASYGAGGSEVGPALAERLGVPFVDRAIPAGVADRLGITEQEAHRRDEEVERGLDRILANMVPMAELYGVGGVDPALLRRTAHHECAAEVIREIAAAGSGVVLGRAGAVVLADDPHALHVRLDGPVGRRIVQAMRVEGIDRETAERRRRKVDRARETYVRRYYDRDPSDPALYHLVLDSTRLPLDACVELVVTALTALQRADDLSVT